MGSVAPTERPTETPHLATHTPTATATVIPTVEASVGAQQVAEPTVMPAERPGQLTEAEMRDILLRAGWPESLHNEALAVAWCESRWSPGVVGDGGDSVGLFQLNLATWFPYAGEDASQWADPLVNARVAWATYQYDIGRGYSPWKQWTCKPW